MPSKFGGVPVDEGQTGGSKFGGIPVDEPSAAVVPTAQPSLGDQLRTAGKSFVGETLHNANPLNITTGIGQTLRHPIDTLTSGMAENRAKFSKDIAGGNYGDAIEHGVGGVVPVLGPLVSRAYDAIGGTPEEAGKSMADLTSLKTVPGAYGLAGKAFKGMASPLAKSALGINGQTEAYGATPGKAILEETHGVRPETIGKSARAKMGDLTSELEGKVNAVPQPIASLRPAQGLVNDRITQAGRANSTITPNELEPLRRFTHEATPTFSGRVQPKGMVNVPTQITPQGGGAPFTVMTPQPAPGPELLEPMQSPKTMLDMKRQVDKDFIGNWNPASNTKGQLGAARQVHHALGSELERTVPGAEDLNQRISSLVPVAKRAELTDLQAGPGERILGRIARPTGGMLPALFGLREGGIPGLALALAGQEGLSSPVAKMIGARTLYGAGKGLSSPIGQLAEKGALIKREKPDEK